VAKPEWGVKRVCQSCAAKFYDLRRSPITCPKCGASFDPEALLKSRRSRPAPPAKVAKPKPADSGGEATGRSGEATGRSDEATGRSDEATGRSNDDDDDSVLQDTSDLGGNDVSDVVVTGSDDDS